MGAPPCHAHLARGASVRRSPLVLDGPRLTGRPSVNGPVTESSSGSPRRSTRTECCLRTSATSEPRTRAMDTCWGCGSPRRGQVSSLLGVPRECRAMKLTKLARTKGPESWAAKDVARLALADKYRHAPGLGWLAWDGKRWAGGPTAEASAHNAVRIFAEK